MGLRPCALRAGTARQHSHVASQPDFVLDTERHDRHQSTLGQKLLPIGEHIQMPLPHLMVQEKELPDLLAAACAAHADGMLFREGG